ncbi:MAG: tRNA preQ1(34) S-adenosylmethionine ribosyltransferase-isomerase QueA [Butyricicoccus sp.]
MKTSDFYYELPESLIAQTPLDRRDSSRLLALNREDGSVAHRHFHDLPEYLRPGDTLVVNNSRVIPARLLGERADSGYPIELVLLTDRGDGVWECLTRPGKKCREGAELTFGGGKLTATVEKILPDGGNRLIRFHYTGVFLEILEELGSMPLPPYIKAKLEDPERYQTVYSKTPGSAAAPTAGLHFTPELLEQIKAMGVNVASVTLHVGLGTFRPVKVEDVADHVMHSEYYMLDEENAAIINQTRADGGRIFAVGTTATRTLETIADEDGTVRACSGWTNIFIYPGYRFKAVDCLITNFHLPESTLMMLISAFAGRDTIMNAYRIAVQEEYRFFSFGDSMLIYGKESNHV